MWGKEMCFFRIRAVVDRHGTFLILEDMDL